MTECFLVAPGPSLDSTDLSLIEGRHVIAINSAFRKIPFARVCYFTDKDWFEIWRAELLLHPGKKIRGCVAGDELMLPWIEEWTFEDHARGLSRKPMHLCHGHNSGAAAINLAVQLGDRTIYLLGYDFRNPDGRQHFDGDEPLRKTPNEAYVEVFAPSFRALVRPLADLGVEVVNLTPNSALKVFPSQVLEESPSQSQPTTLPVAFAASESSQAPVSTCPPGPTLSAQGL